MTPKTGEVIRALNPAGGAIAAGATAATNRIEAGTQQRLAGASVDQGLAEAVTSLAATDPEAAAELAREISANQAEAARARTRRTTVVAGALALVLGGGIGGGIYAYEDTVHTADRGIRDGAHAAAQLARDIFHDVFPPAQVQMLVNTAIEKVKLADDVHISKALVKSDARFDAEHLLCFHFCKTVTGEHNSVEIYKSVEAHLPGSDIKLTTAHVGNGDRLADYFFVVQADPRSLEVDSADPSKQDLQDASLPATTPLVTYGGEDGYLSEIGGALIHNADHGRDTRHAFAYDAALARAKADAAPILDKTIAAGLVYNVRNMIDNNINTLKSLPDPASHKAARTLEELKKKPIAIVYDYQIGGDEGNDPPRSIYVVPSTVHLPVAKVMDIHKHDNNPVGDRFNVDMQTQATGANGTLITPQAMSDLLQIAANQDYFYLPLDYFRELHSTDNDVEVEPATGNAPLPTDIPASLMAAATTAASVSPSQGVPRG